MEHTPLKQLHENALGLLRAGRSAEAADAFVQIFSLYPNDARSAFMLGVICQQTGRVTEALNWLRKAVAIDSAFAEPWFQIGLIFQQGQSPTQAIEAYRAFLKLRPTDAKGLNNLGRALVDSGRMSEAVDVLQQAVQAAPTNAGAYSNLGDALRLTGDLTTAERCYRKAVAIDPNLAEARSSLGAFLVRNRRIAEGIAEMRRALSINPRLYSARFNLARTLQDAGQLDQAMIECRQAIESRPTSADAHNLMGNLLGVAGQVEACIAAQRRAVELKPDHAGAHSNLLLSLHYRSDISAEKLFNAHQDWARQHALRVEEGRQIPMHRTDAGRLRIGYVSPNFSAHSVAYFFEPVLKNHDRSVVEVFCYSDAAATDAVTGRLREMAEHWREIAGLSDEAVLRIIRQDQIDVLIDLAGHTANNRMILFSRRAAPVQMTWLGYPNTTGLVAMDYRITDAIADPPGESDLLHIEKLVRVEGGCWAFAGAENVGVGPVPAAVNKHITFGSFNNLPKVSPQVIEVWAEILKQVPGSRLLVKAAGLDTAIGRDYVRGHFARAGISSDRIELLNWAPSTEAHLKLYGRVDIALDTFPYNGTTTTCEAIWMGVPVVVLAGLSHVSRVGAALLMHGNCCEWIASDTDAYTALAKDLASRVEQLPQIRNGLRDRIKSSNLCNGRRLARQLEQAFQNAMKSLRN